MAAAKKKKTKARAPRRPPATRMAPRADYGKPIDGALARQPAHIRDIAETLRDMIEEAAPEARASLKWGQPSFTIGERTVASIGMHKAHVNLILWGPLGTYADPKGLLSGASKMGAHLRLTAVSDIPRTAVRGWLRTAVKR